jgi:serine/threonine protein phosphatase 1
VVHGHTPTDGVFRDDRRIGLDTGAFISGKLSAVRLFRDEVSFLST